MSDPNLPTPEEVHREFEEFVKKRFGSSVKIFSQHVPNGPAPGPRRIPPTPKKPMDLKFDFKPKQIKNYLDRFVIQQDAAKKALAIAVCDHYNHVRECFANPDLAEKEYSKQNVLILGPTGVGKTYLVRQIAKLIGVPFVKADATRFSETGYVGANVDDLIHDLVAQADGNLDLAQYGIIYLDEADKLASTSNRSGRDVSGRGVQFGLLKLMEETEVDLRAGNDMKSQMQAFMEFHQKGKLDPHVINTRHILFIISGAFTGLAELTKQRLNQNNIGFGTRPLRPVTDTEYLQFASTQDYVNFGFEPEFIGRLPIRVACSDLAADDLYTILQSSEGSIIRQYKAAFQAYGIEIEFEDEALRAIAVKAANEKTGARGLMSVCEQALREFKFELPTLNVDKLLVTKKLVDNPSAELEKIINDPRYLRQNRDEASVWRFAEKFFQDHAMQIKFEEDAINLICATAQSASELPELLCQDLFQSYEHGLKLIKQNTGKSTFTITKKVVLDPQGSLERWIRASYAKANPAKSKPTPGDLNEPNLKN